MKKRLVKLMEKEGFILFLFVCVCLIAGGTLFLSLRSLDMADNKKEDEKLVILENTDINESSLEELDPVEELDTAEEVELSEELVEETESEDVYLESGEDLAALDTDEDEGLEEEEEEEEEEEKLEFIDEEDAGDVEPVNVTEKKPSFIMPVEGPIITEFTKDQLIYSETLEAWIGHKALDIGAKEGTPVLAPMDGRIEKVYEDELWGIVIVIDHGNKLKTRYSNLATREMVKVGGQVKQGDHISKVGKSAKIEMLIEPHLHFEAIKNGELVDPRSINN